MLESDKIKELPRRMDAAETKLTARMADDNTSTEKTEHRLTGTEDESRDVFGDDNKSLDRIEALQRETAKTFE